MQQLSANQGDDKPKSRRACYNALVRLKENPGRMKALPNDLRKRLLEEDGLSKVPSDLVNLMMDVGVTYRSSRCGSIQLRRASLMFQTARACDCTQKPRS